MAADDALSTRVDVSDGLMWYAIWTRSNCERLVADQLSAKAFISFLPETTMWTWRVGQPRLARVPIFPGYLFVRNVMDKRSYIEILKARGVVRILEGGWTRLTAIPAVEIDAIQRLVSADQPVFPHRYFHDGDRVRVVNGPLAGVEGLFVRDKPNKGRLVLSINLLQASVAIEIDAATVEACPPGRLM